MAQHVRCPTCQREIEWSERFAQRPFCSDRCRLIDLGAWLSEQHVLAAEPADSPESAREEPNDRQ
ncbi:MAG TPA: DNA gyrase inhibitor YacG [Steroidobacteraceae bacterium]|jgi:hypothetical protein